MFITIVTLIIVAALMYKFGRTISHLVTSTISNRNAYSSETVPPTEKIKNQDIFFKTVFTLLGYIAKSDGSVNKIEIKITEEFMEKMKLNPEQKRKAIQLFKEGSRLQFNIKNILNDFQVLTQKNSDQTEILLVYLINLARMDGLLVDKELTIIHEVARGLGFSSIAFNHLLQMISSQNKFSQHEQNKEEEKNKENIKSNENNARNERGTKDKQQENSHKKENENKSTNTNKQNSELLAAYEALGIPPTASDIDIKKAYRKLVNQYHPDKLAGQGVPEFIIKAAAESFRKIQMAYLYIKKSRI